MAALQLRYLCTISNSELNSLCELRMMGQIVAKVCVDEIDDTDDSSFVFLYTFSCANIVFQTISVCVACLKSKRVSETTKNPQTTERLATADTLLTALI